MQPPATFDPLVVGVPARLFQTVGASVAPAIDRTVMNNEAALGEPRTHIGGAEAVANVPADGEADDVIREAVACERTHRAGGEVTSPAMTSPALTSQPGLSIFSGRFLPHRMHVITSLLQER